MEDLTAARLWKQRALEAEGKSLADADRLLNVARGYIEANGNELILIGRPIQIIEWPNDPKFVFGLLVKCVGRKPIIPNKSKE